MAISSDYRALASHFQEARALAHQSPLWTTYKSASDAWKKASSRLILHTTPEFLILFFQNEQVQKKAAEKFCNWARSFNHLKKPSELTFEQTQKKILRAHREKKEAYSKAEKRFQESNSLHLKAVNERFNQAKSPELRQKLELLRTEVELSSEQIRQIKEEIRALQEENRAAQRELKTQISSIKPQKSQIISTYHQSLRDSLNEYESIKEEHRFRIFCLKEQKKAFLAEKEEEFKKVNQEKNLQHRNLLQNKTLSPPEKNLKDLLICEKTQKKYALIEVRFALGFLTISREIAMLEKAIHVAHEEKREKNRRALATLKEELSSVSTSFETAFLSLTLDPICKDALLAKMELQQETVKRLTDTPLNKLLEELDGLDPSILEKVKSFAYKASSSHQALPPPLSASTNQIPYTFSQIDEEGQKHRISFEITR